MEEGMTEPFLLKLEVCAATSLIEAFPAGKSWHAAEELAYDACKQLVRREFGDEELAMFHDLLKGIVTYAAMYVQRKREADLGDH
jgi:hypothetical protein